MTPVFTSPFFWLPLFMGISYYVLGYLMIKYPPTDINGFYGYRSKLSKTSLKHWDFAQKFSAIMLKKYGMFCLPFCTLALVGQNDKDLILLLILILICIFPAIAVIYQTEKMLKEF